MAMPVVIKMDVIPVAGQDSMLLNLCGAHAPIFTRNLVVLKDNAGHTGVGEVPGGEGRFGRDRRRRVAGVPGHRRHRRGCAGLQQRQRLRRQHRAGRSDRAGHAARRAGAAAGEDADARQVDLRAGGQEPTALKATSTTPRTRM